MGEPKVDASERQLRWGRGEEVKEMLLRQRTDRFHLLPPKMAPDTHALLCLNFSFVPCESGESPGYVRETILTHQFSLDCFLYFL